MSTPLHYAANIMKWVEAKDRKPTIAFDFDGTIVTHRYPEMGEVRPGMKKMMAELREAGAEIIIFTGRTSNAWPDYKEGDREKAVKEVNAFLVENDVPFDSIEDGTHGKIPADVYYDDKAYRATDDPEADKKGLFEILKL